MVYKSSTALATGAGSVTQINTGTGLTGGPITTSGTISIAPGTANTLAGFDNTGAFAGVTVGSGLSLSGGTLTATGGGTGTVTTVSIVTANGFAGAVANATTTPAITLTTSVTGILQGNGTAISAAATTGTGSVVLAGSPTLTGTPVAPNIALTDNTNQIALGTTNIGTISMAALSAARTWTFPNASGTLALTSGVATSVSNIDGTLTISPTTGSVVASLNLAHGNAWTAAQTIASTSADAFDVGANGATNPALKINASAASSATGIEIVSDASGNGVILRAITSGTNDNLDIRSAGTGSIFLRTGASARLTVTPSQAIFAPTTSSTAANPHFQFTSPADTGLTAATDHTIALYDFAATVQHASNTTVSNDYGLRITAPTYAFAASGGTVTNASSLYISGSPIAGTNATITNSFALNVAGGNVAISTVTSGTWNGAKIGLAFGGTNADLSATGGTSQVLRQSTSGAAVTVSQLSASDLSNGVTGSGAVVLATSPTLTTAVLGSSTATTQTPGDNSTKVATTAYVQAAVFATTTIAACKYATIAALPTATYNNGSSGVGATLTGVGLGALSIDGVTPSIADRILIKNQVSTFQNGIYVVTTVGSVGAAFVLTRSVDYNQSTDIDLGDQVFTTAGATLANTTWTQNGTEDPVIGTDPITFAQTAGPGSYTAGNGIAITGTSIAIDTSVTVDKNTAQTLTNKDLTSGTNIFPTFNQNTTGSAATLTTPRAIGIGGSTGLTATGVNFDGSAAINPALTGTLIVANGGTGATSLTGVLIGNGTSAFTTVTAPSGTIVGTTDTQTLTNKRITRRVVTVNAPGATPSTNTDNNDVAYFTGLNTAITSMTTNLSGTPTNFQPLIFSFVDDGTPRAISWGASFESSLATLPTTTVASAPLDVGFRWDTISSKWRCVAVA